MYALTFEMVDWQGRKLNIPTSKNGEALHIPLNNAAMGALVRVHQRGDKAGRIFRREKKGAALDWRHWMPKAIKLAGIVDFRPHDIASLFRQ